MNNITFVTCYLKIYDNDYDISKTFENRVNYFLKLLNLNINICIFVSDDVYEYFNKLTEIYKNLKIIQVISIDELEMSIIANNNKELYNLPENRNIIKDNKNYLLLMLSKLEFLKKTLDENPYNTNIFCWLDFSLPYIFKNIDNSLEKIKIMDSYQYIDEFLCIPGCWNYINYDIDYLKSNIIWRFCGGLVIGDKNSITKFYNVSKDNFLYFLQKYNYLVWEVNYWSWLESNNKIKPIWYYSDHDDSMINIPDILHKN